MTLENERLHQQIAELTAQRDEASKAKDELAMIVRIMVGPLEAVSAEVEAMEPGRTRSAWLAIEIANKQTNAIAKARENRELRAERDELLAVARELIESTDTSMEGPTVLAVVDGGPFDRLKALVGARTDSTPDLSRAVAIRYTNWRGETGNRRIVPLAIRFAATEWHPEPQWLLEAYDVDKGAARSFAIRDIGEWELDRGEG